ncbi:transmembrane emp24 domain-containing protein p24delta3-like [Iris pallida]|uniref:Transmembrane emp24 domain-containing protein p24delta3-like n=1 Tax=Iris pallida TaxID=29817 RepID=A0AAX6DUL2_IRIPA|nr:transmembrane emp24 domain-containing protein p24delta3-like [Iris pallida]
MRNEGKILAGLRVLDQTGGWGQDGSTKPVGKAHLGGPIKEKKREELLLLVLPEEPGRRRMLTSLSSSSSSMVGLLLALLVAAAAVPGGGAVWLDLPPSGTKCVSEEIQPNVVVLADYSVVHEGAHSDVTIASKVTSPYGDTLHHKEKVKTDQFAFTTTQPGNYLVCFWIDSAEKGVGASVNLDWRIGIAAKDWDSVARKEKLEGVQLELAKLTAVVEAIHENLEYLKDREADMREVSEKTNSRVAWFSIMSLGLCIVVSALQLWHLKSFFQKKKLI